LQQKSNIEENPNPKSMLGMGPSHIILGVLILTRRRMHNKEVHGRLLVRCYGLYACFYYEKSMVEAFDHGSNSMSCVCN
jgi:hypothetical protein